MMLKDLSIGDDHYFVLFTIVRTSLSEWVLITFFMRPIWEDVLLRESN